MDGAIEKLGVYEFFCVFLSGLIFSTICICSGIPDCFLMWSGEDSTIRLITFLSFSCFWGLILQGIGAYVDKKWKFLGLSHQVRKNFLETGKNRVFKEESERSEFDRLVNKTIMKKYDGSIELGTTKERCYWAYQYFATILEYYGKDAKIERIGSLSGMLRSLMVMGPVLTIFHGVLFFLEINKIMCIGYDAKPYSLAVKILSFLIVAVFFWYRASKFARYKVRVLLREYRQFVSENNNENVTEKRVATNAATGS